jgi:hypothetical protein
MTKHVAARQTQADATCAVQLFDRRTGEAHRLGGAPLRVFTTAPDQAASDLLAGRDPAVWEARIQPLGGAA